MGAVVGGAAVADLRRCRSHFVSCHVFLLIFTGSQLGITRQKQNNCIIHVSRPKDRYLYNVAGLAQLIVPSWAWMVASALDR
eukprot:COSAG02_NODE_3460_length_6698_cov_7.368238_5_plen_82_part_00